jgi:hypothetical protein
VRLRGLYVVALVRSRPRIRAAAAAVALLAGAAAAAPAGAATVELDAGTTTLQVDTRALSALGVSVAPVTPATSGRRGIALPITGGRINPATAAGQIAHAGGLQLRRGASRIRLTTLLIRSGPARTISVKAGAARLDAFSIAMKKATVRRRGFATTVADAPVKLTAKGAAALNRALRVAAFRRGTRIGTATVRSQPAELAFDGGASTLALDAGAAATLQSVGVAVAPLPPAFANADGTIAFPITRGKVNAKTLAGSIDHRGGLVFSRGPTGLTVKDFVIHTAGLPRLDADLDGRRADFVTLDVAPVVETVSGRTETLAGVVARLTPEGAAALNQAFGTTAFTGGQLLGNLTIAAHVT